LDGEILVAAQTDIAWTLLFPRASAIVTDVGALLSHAAIVAHELGFRPSSAAATPRCACAPATRCF